jgi:acetyltransferase-like isoleucine patch superfamily enzyme
MINPLLRFAKSLLVSASFFLVRFASILPSNHLRKLALTCMGAKLGKNVVIYSGFEVRSPWKLVIGEGTTVGHNCILDCRGGITVGSNVNFSSEAAIWTAQHDPQSPTFAIKVAAVVIEDRAWLSFRSTVLPGITVHEGAVLAAHAVATKDIPPFVLAGGVPAKVIGPRNENLAYNLADSGYVHMI